MLANIVGVLLRLRNLSRNLFRSGLGLAMIPILLWVLIGTFGYSWLEGWTLIESLYATIITITTVGYGDFSPATVGGRIFAVFFTLGAIGMAGYAISTLAAVVIQFETTYIEKAVKERRMKRLADLKDHIIICGGSVVGQRVANEFNRHHESFVIIEDDEATLKRALLWMHEGYISKRLQQFDQLIDIELEEENKSIGELAEEIGVLYLQEDPASEQHMRRAGIERARGLVAALNDDRDNISVILSARHMANQLGNSNLRLVAHALDELNIRRLYLAGADKVVAPNFVGGHYLASSMLSPVLSDFMEDLVFQNTNRIRFADMRMVDHPKWIGETVAYLKEHGDELVLAIRRDNQYIYSPDMTEILRENDTLVVMGALES